MESVSLELSIESEVYEVARDSDRLLFYFEYVLNPLALLFCNFEHGSDLLTVSLYLWMPLRPAGLS